MLDLAPKPLSPVGKSLPERVLARIGDRALASDLRADSVRLLALLDGKSSFDLLAALLDPQEPEEVQVAAVRALAQTEGGGAGKLLISKWREMTTDVRLGATSTLLSKPETVELLLASIENEDVPFWTISQRHKSRLVMHADPSIRARVHDLMRKLESRRLAALQRYRAALGVAGDPVQGAAVFEKNCEKCHEIEGADAGFGPDLGPVRHRSRQELLADIMLPSRAIADNFQLSVVELSNGVLQEGVIASQTPVSVTLRQGRRLGDGHPPGKHPRHIRLQRVRHAGRPGSGDQREGDGRPVELPDQSGKRLIARRGDLEGGLSCPPSKSPPTSFCPPTLHFEGVRRPKSHRCFGSPFQKTDYQERPERTVPKSNPRFEIRSGNLRGEVSLGLAKNAVRGLDGSLADTNGARRLLLAVIPGLDCLESRPNLILVPRFS